MQGSPPFQALLLLIALSVLGFAGVQYIGMGKSVAPEPSSPETATKDNTVEAEIEFIFSSPPLSYQLVKPSDTGGEDIVLLQSSQNTENPCYGNVRLTTHRLATYWLDVRWPEDPPEKSHHSVQITVSPSHGESQQYAFFTSFRGIDESFDYSTGESDHE